MLAIDILCYEVAVKNYIVSKVLHRRTSSCGRLYLLAALRRALLSKDLVEKSWFAIHLATADTTIDIRNAMTWSTSSKHQISNLMESSPDKTFLGKHTEKKTWIYRHLIGPQRFSFYFHHFIVCAVCDRHMIMESASYSISNVSIFLFVPFILVSRDSAFSHVCAAAVVAMPLWLIFGWQV